MLDMKKLKKTSYDPTEKKARMSMLKDFMCQMDDIMADDLKSEKTKKVTVMAKDDKGLKEGLEKAEDLVEQNMEPSEESSQESSEESSEEGSEETSKEEIEAQIEELRKKLAQME